jgi:predicted AlkP superfamily phosphohydrolase/phosphomutase
MSKVCVIGIDGASFDVIKPLVKKGKMPNLGKLMSEGAFGNLKSVHPPMTAPAWVSFATGKHPGKHGCFDFTIPGDTLGYAKPISSRNIEGKTFYELLELHGKRCVLINLPCSYPPRIKGTVLTGLLTRGYNSIFPKNLKEKMPELENYRIIFDLMRIPDKDFHLIELVRKMHATIFTCSKALFKKTKWDFFFVMFYGIDMIQHRKYGEMISYQKKENPDWLKVFEELDNYIGWFLDNAPKNTTFLIISDHGFHIYKGVFFINVWLMNEGYLQIKKKKLGANEKKKLISHSFKFKMRDFLLRHPRITNILYVTLQNLPQKIGITNKILETTAYMLSKGIEADLKNTVAYCPPQLTVFGVYLNDRERFRDGIVKTGDEYEKIRKEIIRKLKNLRDEETGQPLFKDVKKREDMFSSRCLKRAPDIVLELNNYWIKPYYLKFPRHCVTHVHYHHSLKGICIAYGQKIKGNAEIKDAQLVDIAPTILHLMGTPIPKDMDGKILKEMIANNSTFR